MSPRDKEGLSESSLLLGMELTCECTSSAAVTESQPCWGLDYTDNVITKPCTHIHVEQERRNDPSKLSMKANEHIRVGITG